MSEALEGLFRSPRPIQRANGPHEVRSVPPRPSLAAALLDGLLNILRGILTRP